MIEDASERAGPGHGGVCVTGATSPVAAFLLPRLRREGYPVYALGRRVAAGVDADGVAWCRAELEGGSPLPAMAGLTTLVHLAPLWLLPPRIEAFARMGVRRVIAFGSTSRFTKQDSASVAEQALAARLAGAEAALAGACGEHSLVWTLFRPTLTYGSGRDGNIAFIARVVRRYGVFPLAAPATGRRQPVHADDLAAACIAALECPATQDRAYNLPGGETLSYRRMVEAVFAACGRAPRFVSLPPTAWRLALGALSLWPRAPRIGLEMVARMNTDMVFDLEDAQRDFGYSPRPFQP